MLRLYTDESPGLKVDPMVILFLSLGFIFSVVALHREFDLGPDSRSDVTEWSDTDFGDSYCEGHEEILMSEATP
jgi:hypothetical protein